MQAETHWYRLDGRTLPGGVVAVDASSSAQPFWAGPIASVLEGISEGLPHTEHPEVVFLGDRIRHALDRVLAVASSPSDGVAGLNLESQLGRYPAAGPLFRDLLDEPPRPVLLLLSGMSRPIIDLEDWADPEFARRVLAYRLTGSTRQTCAVFEEMGPDADLERAVDHLRDPVEAVTIGGGGAIVVDWNEDGWSWREGCLACDHPASIGIEVRLCHPPGIAPRAVIARRSGTTLDLPLSQCVGPDPCTPIAMTPGECNVLDAWERNRSFSCSHCRQNHSPGQLGCAGPAPSYALFPSVGSAPPAAAYVAKTQRGGQWSLVPHPRGLIALREDRVAVRTGHRTGIYILEGSEWKVQKGETPGFPAVDEGGFAVFR
ncbi:MAG: hypothetical protein U0791_26295 [Gemmataceae bacterium]